MKRILRFLFSMWILPAAGKFALAVTITYVDATGPVIRVGFNLAPSGSYVTGGDTVNLSTATQDPSYVGMVPAIESLGAPIDFDIWDTSGDILYATYPVMGATAATCKLKRSASGTFGTELAAAAYPAGIVTDKLMGEAVFNKL
jgi:hypothetical protein